MVSPGRDACGAPGARRRGGRGRCAVPLRRGRWSRWNTPVPGCGRCARPRQASLRRGGAGHRPLPDRPTADRRLRRAVGRCGRAGRRRPWCAPVGKADCRWPGPPHDFLRRCLGADLRGDHPRRPVDVRPVAAGDHPAANRTRPRTPGPAPALPAGPVPEPRRRPVDWARVGPAYRDGSLRTLDRRGLTGSPTPRCTQRRWSRRRTGRGPGWRRARRSRWRTRSPRPDRSGRATSCAARKRGARRLRHHPGVGIPPVVLSGKLAAARIAGPLG